jgi:hypothetical protein
MTITSTITSAENYYVKCVADGYYYECACGEMYNSIDAAASCRKCRNYCVFGYCTHVIDVRDSSVAAGIEPSKEEYEEAAIIAEAEWARESAELNLWRAQDAAADAAAAAAKEELRIERAEKAVWDIQDNLMGFIAKY